jgi:alkylhydroperoxidase family enzyme
VSDSRIPRPAQGEAEAAAAQAGVPRYLANLNIFQVLLRHPRLARAFSDLTTMLLFEGDLDARLRELAIMRIGWVTGSEYEWSQHWRIARSLGVSTEDLLAVREGPSHPAFAPAERAVLSAVDEVVTGGSMSAATWQSCVRALGAGPHVMLELVAVIGAWRMVASLLLSLAIPLEEGVDRWPPDGRAPEHPRASG